MLSEQEALAIIKSRLSNRRLQHSLQVAVEARELAVNFGVSPQKAYLTGILHDYAKGMPASELLNIATVNNLLEHEVDRLVPDLLHAPVGAFLLKTELGIDDEEILQAVKCHTLGSLHMSALDKIIYLADMIEPGRDFPGLERLKCLAWRNLDEGMLFGLESTIKYCLDQQRIIHPLTIEVRNHFLKEVKFIGC
ncbi:MAG TPA: HD domain-containing protein [Gelria sp.]|jgi:predicted HD superfamily hydrolase involved in NAD metabolism|nr:HD domain-containing protein [Gelria sp.]